MSDLYKEGKFLENIEQNMSVVYKEGKFLQNIRQIVSIVYKEGKFQQNIIPRAIQTNFQHFHEH